ncbi:hypothetical protein COV06_01085 [Candidatus Uhrbacteria bacterium CG10_big_fil_rev_8_21_14_0_10_50_16]|uniref:50S ribosomal protein L7/L12 n=1 Tax=Candidatus Uhrbacteria bacterium CG10_big_fil_rev_8_21_14_0_10_50_16 TaxID=1975039 RepID=A0A2H0RNF8_9BACT|nr:MAG: hypothetical protein COV06_01085 [Candidatus Uhrbacteria bacterium CG10_big_fil_rev_8_21_14_0_10_50_16]
MPFLPTFDDANDQFALEPNMHGQSEEVRSPDQRVRVAIRALRQMRQQMDNVLDMLERGEGDLELDTALYKTQVAPRDEEGEDRTVEGVFDGERMMGTDGVKYNIPPNYASKSKLVEGDIMKLVIKEDGSFIFKQIGPVERDRVVGTLAIDDYGNYALIDEDGTSYHVLTASVTYFRGEAGDEIVGLLPQGQTASWAAVENIIKK